MQRRSFLKTAGSALALSAGIGLSCGPRGSQRPNIIFFLADDLGSQELGCFGQDKIRTPHIDRLAAEGMRFPQCYSGSPVCAPSRCVLLTGLHSGHAWIRNNSEVGTWESFEGQKSIPEGTVTIAGLLKQKGYATAAIGKWGLGKTGSTGDPNRQGFDLFFGYNCQRHAHNYYPVYLWRNQEKVVLEGNDRGLTGEQYAPDLMEAEALSFIEENRDRPFFLYFATPVPHLALQVPEDSLAEYLGLWEDPPYDGSRGYLPHRAPRAAYAAMVTRMDRTMGRILDKLEALGIDENTVVFFSSDNGPTYTGGYDREFFRGAGDLRGHKGSVYEGGIRVPMIVRCPKRIEPGTVSGHICAFQDVMPTVMELAGFGESVPASMDGISFAGTLTGRGCRKEHPFLYMEFPSYGGQQMVRMGKWKAVRQNLLNNPDAAVELYDLEKDGGETADVASENPGIVGTIRDLMKEARTPSAEFPFPALDGPADV